MTTPARSSAELAAELARTLGQALPPLPVAVGDPQQLPTAGGNISTSPNSGGTLPGSSSHELRAVAEPGGEERTQLEVAADAEHVEEENVLKKGRLSKWDV